ncbi:MAG: hypothetical protein M1828_001046 [Chrysothrix sp. TS-e1954]|nr:MAG: hypothetical protein M1828_001046 [Chrysothrix sp. TS-e1954]
MSTSTSAEGYDTLYWPSGYVDPGQLQGQPPAMAYSGNSTYAETAVQYGSVFHVTMLQDRVIELETNLSRLASQLRASVETTKTTVEALREEIQRIKKRERDLIPVMSSLLVEKLAKLAAKGEKPQVEEENIKSWLQEYSSGERYDQESEPWEEEDS